MCPANNHPLAAILKKIHTDPVRQHYFPISIHWQQGTFLASLIRKFQPKFLLELGSGYGVSSLWIQSALLPTSTHIAVDPWATHPPDIRTTLKNRRYSLVTSHTSQEYLARNARRLRGKLDFVLMDADERFDGCMTDVYFVNQIMMTGGLLIIRNAWNPSVRKMCQFILTNLPYHLVGLPTWATWLFRFAPFIGVGLLLFLLTRWYTAEFCVLKKTGPDKRPWNHFKNFC